MIHIEMRPREEIERAWREYESERVREGLKKTPRIVNAHTTAVLLDSREYVFRGRKYRCPPVPWRWAEALLRLDQELKDSGGEKAERSDREILSEVLTTVKRAVHPSGWRRLFWRITPNPFRNATPGEVGHVLGFCCLCVRIDDYNSRNGIAFQIGISPPNSPGSSTATRPGSGKTASRSRGGTSSTVPNGRRSMMAGARSESRAPSDSATPRTSHGKTRPVRLSGA